MSGRMCGAHQLRQLLGYNQTFSFWTSLASSRSSISKSQESSLGSPLGQACSDWLPSTKQQWLWKLSSPKYFRQAAVFQFSKLCLQGNKQVGANYQLCMNSILQPQPKIQDVHIFLPTFTKTAVSRLRIGKSAVLPPYLKGDLLKWEKWTVEA